MIKRMIIISAVILCTLFTGLVHASGEQSNQEYFLQGNQLYKKHDYAGAYAAYSKIKNKSRDVHYNLGNCSFKLNNLGYALLHWRRAERNWGLFERGELLDNIKLVQKNLGLYPDGTKPRSPSNPFASIVRLCKTVTSSFTSFVRSAPLLFLQIIFLLVWGFLLLYVRYLYKRRNWLIVLTLFSCLAASGAMIASKYGDMYRIRGVVVAAQAKLFSGPDNTYQLLRSLKEGQEGVVKRVSADFYKIKIGSIIGWIHRKNFELL